MRTRMGTPVLSARELEVVGLVSLGYHNPEIAERLCIGIETVSSHIDHILAKLGLGNRTEIAVWWAEQRAAAHRTS